MCQQTAECNNHNKCKGHWAILMLDLVVKNTTLHPDKNYHNKMLFVTNKQSEL